jgi:hypothetical protein
VAGFIGAAATGGLWTFTGLVFASFKVGKQFLAQHNWIDRKIAALLTDSITLK